MKALTSLPDAERRMLFLAGHIVNELNSLNKVFAWCLSNQSEERPSQLSSVAQGVQAMIYARVLAGKLSEAWESLKPAWFRNKLAGRLSSSLHPDSVAAQSTLKAYFGKSNPISRVRNSFAFHYSARAVAEHWEEAVHEEKYCAIFGGTIGNNLHLGAEMVANVAVLRSIGHADSAESLRVFFHDVQTIAHHMTTFLDGITMRLTENALSKNLQAAAEGESIDITHSFGEVSVPYFCAPDPKGV